MDALSQQKTDLRTAAAARRDALPAEERKAAAETIAARAFPIAFAPGIIVSGFMPMRSEINPLPLMKALAEKGAQLALPKIAGRGKPLIMRAWTWGAPLDTGQWGIREPKAEYPEIDPDIVLVPMLVFARTGHRIGYGAGYYDRTIGGLRSRKKVTAVGIAFAMQEVPTVPATEHDARLDLVLTEKEVIDFR